MYMFLIVVHIFASLVLIGVILMQAGRGGGVSEVFGGSSTKTIFGTSATKFLQRATAACAVIFILTSLSLAVLSAGRSRSLMDSGGAALMDVEGAMQIPIEGAESVPIDETAAGAVEWGGEETAGGGAEKTAEKTAGGAADVPQEDAIPAKDEKGPIEPTSE